MNTARDMAVRGRITAYLRRQGECSPAQVAIGLGLSGHSVRTALKRMADEGTVVRVAVGCYWVAE